MKFFGKKGATLEFRSVLHRMILMWYFSHKYLFMVLLIVTASYGLWFWKKSVYQYRWTDEQKRIYLNQHAKETNFREDKFKAVLEEARIREESFRDKKEFRDIFYAE